MGTGIASKDVFSILREMAFLVKQESPFFLEQPLKLDRILSLLRDSVRTYMSIT